MLEQTFSTSDIPRVIVLIFLEWLLSMDNALILALIAKRLPQNLQKKALFIGLSSTVVLRAAAIFLVVHLLQFTWIQWVGAGYLLYLSIRYFFSTKKKALAPVSPKSFWQTVFWIEITDLLFALDSILAAVAFISTSLSSNQLLSKLWIIYIGALVGLVGVRFAAKGITHLLGQFPRLPACSHLLIGWIGLHLALSGLIREGWVATTHLFYEITFWVGIVFFIGIGLSKRTKAHR